MTTAKRTIVEPVELPKVGEKHHRGIFGDFREVVGTRISELQETGSFTNLETARFFEYLLGQVDALAYAEIQRDFLSSEKLDPESDLAKYLDPIVWFESKLRIARKLKLHEKPPLKIVDLGTGPGHFPVVARFYGHDVTGTELPRRSMGVDKTGHLYDSLCEIYRVRRLSHTIRPNEPVGDLGGKYDVVTAFLVAFSVDQEKRPWTADHWRSFLGSLKCDALTDGGELFMTLANQKLTDETWDYLKTLAESYDDKSKQILICNFTTLN